jgi:transcriptional regulator NrdR family protein
MIACPGCAMTETSVKDTRSTQFGTAHGIRRRRKCTRCNVRFSTIEITVEELEALTGGDPSEMFAAVRAVESAAQRLGGALRRRPSA